MVTRKTNANNEVKPVSNGKTKIIAGAIGVTVIAGGAGYAYNEIISPPGSIYTVSYYKLRKAKNNLANLEVRANDEAPTNYNSNGNVSSDWTDTNASGCKTRSDILLNSLENAVNNKCDVQSGELFDYY
ncbi:hypothetical protein IJ135_02190, partial [Candidatus Saccharibacteria bacterium]|nr:hypothetical protein [Candidatus Saccharibacteria bacterium]